MVPRFYAPALDARSEVIDLPADESHHLAHVLRLRVGDPIAVFDGRGLERHGRVERIGRHEVRVRLLESVAAAVEPRIAIALTQAVLKGDKMDAIVRDATMLGVASVQPLITARTVVSAKAASSGKARERWRRVAIASAKQCRRAVVPEILDAASFETIVAGLTPGRTGLILVEPSAGGGQTTSVAALRDRPVPAAATLVVGPEGGWDRQEIATAVTAGWLPLTVGSATLRADAAPLVAIATLRAVWNDL
jgi:16S rRNA (uracil1498-N3)-methyltransferase